MTREQLEKLEPRELDALVGEKVMLFAQIRRPRARDGCVLMHRANSSEPWTPTPHYSSKIEPAMTAVDKCLSEDRRIVCQGGIRGWSVALDVFGMPTNKYDMILVEHEFLPRAICIAALLAVEERHELL